MPQSSPAEPATQKFDVANLSIFERHGAIVERPGRDRAGCWVKMPNGWTLSIQWGGSRYGSNYDCRASAEVPPAALAEIAAWPEDGSMVTWSDGDTVQGYCSVERVLHIIDLLAADKLMQDYQPPTERRAVDGFEARP